GGAPHPRRGRGGIPPPATTREARLAIPILRSSFARRRSSAVNRFIAATPPPLRVQEVCHETRVPLNALEAPAPFAWPPPNPAVPRVRSRLPSDRQIRAPRAAAPRERSGCRRGREVTPKNRRTPSAPRP